jgi:RNA polymerase sigma-70 factor (ECF subfamily)
MEVDNNTQRFLEAYDLFADGLYRHAIFRVSNADTATDIVQETFTRTWEYLSKGNHVDEFKPFLYRTLHNLVIDHYRKRKPVVSIDELALNGFDVEGAGREEEEIRIDATLLLELLDDLEEKDKNVLLLRYIDDLSIEEIAGITDEKQNAISVRIHRALKKLKKIHDERN